MKICHPIQVLEATGIVNAGITLRHGGVSRASYASLNLAEHVDDNPSAVTANRQVFFQHIGLADLLYCRQIHSACVIDVDRDSVPTDEAANPAMAISCRGAETDSADATLTLGSLRQSVKCYVSGIESGQHRSHPYSESIKPGDALVSAQRGVALGIFTADCVPVFILDRATPAIGIAHAGWRGTLAQVAVNALARMKTRFGTIAGNCIIHLGPSIQECCYTVSPELITQFAAHLGSTVHDGKHLSLQTPNIRQLVEAGVPADAISVSPFCTACCTDKFYSYRAEGGITGRMLSFIELK